MGIGRRTPVLAAFVAITLAACSNSVAHETTNGATTQPGDPAASPSSTSLASSSSAGPEGATGAADAPATSTAAVETSSTTLGIPTTAVSSPAVVMPDDWSRFDRSLAKALVGRGAWSISVAVAKDGQIVHTAAVGVADPSKDPDADPNKQERTADPDDRYRFASNSKVLTAIVVMRLVEEGRLTLDEPVTPRLAARLDVEQMARGVASITTRQLLGHTSGFDEFDRTFFGSRVDSCAEAAVVGLTAELDTAPGTSFQYSNMNYCLLGLLIEDVTGKDYEAAVEHYLLDPLGLDGLRVAGTHDVRKGDAHHISGEARNYMEVLQAAGAWVGTAEDLVRIVDSLDVARPGRHVLSAETVATMLAHPAVDYPFSGRWYGLGLRVWADGSWGHTGTVENARSMVLHRADGITWAVMVNGDAPKPTDHLRDLVDEAFAQVGISSTG